MTTSQRLTPRRAEAWLEEHAAELQAELLATAEATRQRIRDWAEKNSESGEEADLAAAALAGALVDAALDTRTWQAVLAENSGLSRATIATAVGLDRGSKIDRWPGYVELLAADKAARETLGFVPEPVDGKRLRFVPDHYEAAGVGDPQAEYDEQDYGLHSHSEEVEAEKPKKSARELLALEAEFEAARRGAK